MTDYLESQPPECVQCGACCFSQLPDYVPVRGDDYERLGDAAEALTVWNGVRCFMRMRDGHCAALQLEPHSGRYLCSVYEQRPETCRLLERGSPECAGERHQKHDRARRALLVC